MVGEAGTLRLWFQRMSRESVNREIVASAYDALVSQDDDAFLDPLAPDIEWIVPGPPDHPATGTHHGKDALLKMFGRFGTVAELLHIEIEQVVGDGDVIVVLGRERWRVRESGREFEPIWSNAVLVEDGLISRVTVCADTHDEMAAYAGR